MSVTFLAVIAGCFAFQIYSRVAVQVEAAARAAAVARFSRKEEHAAQGAAALLSAYRRGADPGEAGVAESEEEDESSLPAGDEEAHPQVEAERAGQPARGLSRMAGSTRELQQGRAGWSRKAAERAFFAPEASGHHGAPQ